MCVTLRYTNLLHNDDEVKGWPDFFAQGPNLKIVFQLSKAETILCHFFGHL